MDAEQRVWSRPVVWERSTWHDGQPTVTVCSPSNIRVDDPDFCEPESLHTRSRAWRRSRPFPSQPGPLNTPAGLTPMIDLMQRARDRETYGGACG